MSSKGDITESCLLKAGPQEQQVAVQFVFPRGRNGSEFLSELAVDNLEVYPFTKKEFRRCPEDRV